jgi:uncharacterized OB-fold protein
MGLDKEAGRRAERIPGSEISADELSVIRNLNGERCQDCGRRVYPDQQFCPGCGRRIYT